MTPYFENDAVTIYHGDCLDILSQLEPVDHVITDPPFEADAHSKGRRVKRAGYEPLDRWAWIDTSGTPRYEALDFEAITPVIRQSVALQMARLVKRWALVFCQSEAAHEWESQLVCAGLTRRRWCVWVKPDAQPQFSGDRPGVGYETIVTTHAKGRSTWNGGGRVGVFRFNKSRGETGHQTEKPLALMRELVSLFTDPGDTILDPFAGSGTTGRAAMDLGRKAILIEKEERWCEVAAKRMAQGVLL